MTARIEYYWSAARVNWRLVGANGETMCQSTQGYRDKRDARRSVAAVARILGTPTRDSEGAIVKKVREVGPE